MELKYNISSFTAEEFSEFMQKYHNQKLQEDIYYFHYSDAYTYHASDLYKSTCRFIVAYTKKLILGIAKVAVFDLQNDHISISYLSVHKDYQNKGICKKLTDETVKVVKEFNIPLGTSEYSVLGWKYLRKSLLASCEKYQVTFLDNIVGFPGKNGLDEEFYALRDESKQIFLEKHPEKKDYYIW